MLTSINTIHYRLDDTNQRLRDLRTEMNQRFNAQDKYINQRFDAQDQRLERLENDASELHRLVVSIRDRVSRNEAQIDLITRQLTTGTIPPATDQP